MRTLTYHAGALSAVAYRNGEKWSEATVKTTGKAMQLKVEPEKPTIAADGKEIGFVTVRVCDAEGLMVPRTRTPIKVTVSGAGEFVAADICKRIRRARRSRPTTAPLLTTRPLHLYTAKKPPQLLITHYSPQLLITHYIRRPTNHAIRQTITLTADIDMEGEGPLVTARARRARKSYRGHTPPYMDGFVRI